MRYFKFCVIIFLGTIIVSANGQVNDQKQDELKKTVQNLKDAIKGEATSSAKYLAYSKKAKEEGYENIELLFTAASKSESIHEKNYRAALEKLGEKMDEFKPVFTVKSTKENLEDAINGETYEVEIMYPGFKKSNDDDTFSDAGTMFDYAYKTEMKHDSFFRNALNFLNEGKVSSLASVYYICPVCGNTIDNLSAYTCDISMTPTEKFLEIKI